MARPMSARPDGFVDFDDLPAERRNEARVAASRHSQTLTGGDAPLLAFRITKRGRVSRSRPDVRPSTAAEDSGMRRVW